jgi:MFS family permease
MTTTLTTKQLFFLSFLIALGAINSCAYTPALPDIANFFQRSLQKTQLLIVTSLLAHCVAPLIFATLANYFSRFKSVYIGLAICLLGDSLCLLAKTFHNFYFMVLGIFLLSFGGNMGMTLTLTLIKDQSIQRIEKPLKLTALSFAILPGLMITLSGALLSISQWPIVFMALGIYHLVLFLGTVYFSSLFEKVKPQVKLLSFKPLTQKKFLLPVMTAGCLSGMTYTFSALSPNIAMHMLGISSFAFGLWSNIPSLGMLAGSLLALNFSLKALAKVKLLFITCISFALAGMTITFLLGAFSPVIFFFSIGLIFCGIQLLFPFIATISLNIKSNESASSSAWMTSIHFLTASQFVNLANHLPFTAITSLLIVNTLCAALAIFMIY